jgi:hypothetical protein
MPTNKLHGIAQRQWKLELDIDFVFPSRRKLEMWRNDFDPNLRTLHVIAL